MKPWKVLPLIAASATMLALGTASIAHAGSPYYKFGAGTGIHSVTYSGFTSYMSRGGSGVVEQWVAPTAGNHGAYYLYKPMSNTTVTTPFKQSCDEPGLVAMGGLNPWPYQRAAYDPVGILDPYFPINGLTYWVCVGSASNYATADYTYTVFGTGPTRHATFDVQMAGPGFPASGTFSYSDTDGITYTVHVTDVLINGNLVTFSGPMPGGTSWLEAQVIRGPGGTVASAGGDVVSSDPAGTLGTFIPTTMADATPTGTMFIYTR